MSLVYAALFLAGWASAGVLAGGWVLSRLGTRVNVMDDDVHDAFGYVGDTVGALMVRVNRIEEALAEDSEDEVDYAEDVYFATLNDPDTFGPWGDF